ncbi:MAG: NAD(P)/FAD-dependent oxidoreductase [Bacilli bacterium]
MTIWDVIVVGGGTSGLMASYAAAHKRKKVLLIEKGNAFGRKMLISGGGRCNVTNRKPVDEIIKHIPGNGRFLYSAFSHFNNEDIIHFFEKSGLKLKEEDHGRMFPHDDQASSIVRTLLTQIEKRGVEHRTNTSISSITRDDKKFTLETSNGETFHAHNVVLATGGKTAQKTGSTGDGYKFAQALGHTITRLFPTEVPLVSNETFIQNRKLQGVSLRGVSLSVLNDKGKPLVTHTMDMIFTHWGVSGPAALRCSSFALKQIEKNGVATMRLDVAPEMSVGALETAWTQNVKTNGKKQVGNTSFAGLPERMWHFLLEQAGIDVTTVTERIDARMRAQLFDTIKQFKFIVTGTRPFEQAFVTGGGVSTKEIWPQTMESKITPGLYFCGELIDIHGYTGGYNITAALVTGYTAGKHAGE